LVLKLFESFNKQDLDDLMEILSDDFTYNLVTRYILDKKGYREFIEVLYSSFSGVRIHVDRTISQGDTVVAETIFRGVHKNEYLGMPATGKLIEAPSVYIFDFEKRKIKLIKYYSNLQNFLEQLSKK
jgi:steroid delta-isomerase-like uncharacterized protein